MGTVQLGLAYGRANVTGMPDESTAIALVRRAHAAGIRLYDTAAAYGLSEERLGLALMGSEGIVITKSPPLSEYDDTAAPAEIRTIIQQSIERSLTRLRCRTLPYVLMHRAEHMRRWDGVVWETLLALVKAGLIERVGVSVSTPDEAHAVLARQELAAIQLPLHALDRRWRDTGVEQTLRERPDILVLARSTLLQGVLALPASDWPSLEPAKASAMGDLLDGWVRQWGRASRADLCLAYVRALPWVHSLVIGMETEKQLDENIALFMRPPLDDNACAQLERECPVLPERFLNPSLWARPEITNIMGGAA